MRAAQKIFLNRKALLKAVPCFASLTETDYKKLAQLLQEENFAPGQVVVAEDQWVDKIYLIESGQAEVHQSVIKGNKKIFAPVAILRPGDTIGLNDRGFYSTTGKRTATVTALTNLKTLVLEVKTLYDFLGEQDHLQNEMYETAGQMLRVQLIKQALPFAKLSIDRIKWLSELVEERTFAEGEIIFAQGDKGDKCYLIESGQIEIVARHENGEEERLAVLKSPMLFGEATLISNAPRNATARALTDCQLLTLENKNLSELVENESEVAKMFMHLMVNRSRPKAIEGIETYQRTSLDGQPIVILKNPENGNYFKLSPAGWFIWQQLDGKKTMQVLTLSLAHQMNIFAPELVVALLSKLAKAGFVENIEMGQASHKKKNSYFSQQMTHIRNLLEIRYSFGDADRWVTNVYNSGVYLLFKPLGRFIFSLVCVVGFGIFIYTSGNIINTFRFDPNTWWIFAALVPATIIAVALHELGHAFATKYYGHEVHYIGIGWFWLKPVAFTDTSDMWLSDPGPRTVVNLAGVMTNMFLGGICSFLILLVSNPYIEVFLWVFALYTYVGAFRMLSPLQELDGYYVLMDWLEKPQLRPAAITWLMKGFPKAIRKPSLFKKNKAEVVYWLACLLYLICISGITLLVQSLIFKIFGIHPEHPYLVLLIPLTVAFLSAVGIINDLRRQES